MFVHVPYGKTSLTAEIPEHRLSCVLTPLPKQSGTTGVELVKEALENPAGSMKLRDLAANSKRIVIVTSDHTRPVPSHLTLPLLLQEIRSLNPEADITILIATGLHRAPTPPEMAEKFGSEVVSREHFVSHDANETDSLVRLQDLPSGAPFLVNRLAAEADLLVAEGFIEPHFFAGYSGGRKSILPGISGKDTILVNHSAEFIDHACTRAGNLTGNIFHRDMMAAADQANLKFILNVALDETKQIIGAFAGSHRDAFAQGVEFVAGLTKLTCPKSEIVVTSNGGYPLDQNLYQAVKGIRTAEFAVKTGGVIIAVDACSDGIGGEEFFRLLTEKGGASEKLKAIRGTAPGETALDQWEAQVLLRALSQYRIIMISEGIKPEILNQMGLESAPDLEAALESAYNYMGENAKVVVIPNGAGTFVEAGE